ncbi:substrate-binding domain-containing protein [Adhaeribacter pallidiroseus]|uniref:Glucan 1,3-alpha-glucosidase n=1 Tax=Adhaeribacter pallidiroseus TaxID=2072847 RepID=A0A369QEA1_9BACT|nr:substrate-binding domain-containing protein [Adhaeribacter pallidiroseus]RDC62640.1 Glucan 1,3-alpha-glucosidase [Adhaeribacter pallidiroseus]
MQETTHLRIGGVPEHFNIPWHQAIEQGLFQAENINLTWTDYPGGTGAMAKDLRHGTIDIAVLLTEGIVADIANGNESKIVQVYVESPLIWGIHVPANAAYQMPEDLHGKRYAVSRMGSGSHLMAFVDATQRGWNPQAQELVLVGNLDGARQAFKNNEADAFMWEKFMTKPLVDSGEFRRVGETLTPWPCFVIAVRKEVLQKQQPAIQKVLTIINHTCQRFMTNPQSVDVVVEKFKLQPEDAVAWFKSTRWSTGEPVSEEMLQTVISTLQDLQVITTAVKPADLYQQISLTSNS